MFILFGFIFPFLYLAAVLILWAYPMTLSGQRWLHMICESCQCGQALEVLLVAVIVAGGSVSAFSAIITEEVCREIDSALRVFNQWIQLENPTCFSSAGEIEWRICFLCGSAAVVVVVCSVMLHLSRQALTDRSFLPDELVKMQRSKWRRQVAKAKTSSFWFARSILMILQLVRYVEDKDILDAMEDEIFAETKNRRQTECGTVSDRTSMEIRPSMHAMFSQHSMSSSASSMSPKGRTTPKHLSPDMAGNQSPGGQYPAIKSPKLRTKMGLDSA